MRNVHEVFRRWGRQTAWQDKKQIQGTPSRHRRGDSEARRGVLFNDVMRTDRHLRAGTIKRTRSRSDRRFDRIYLAPAESYRFGPQDRSLAPGRYILCAPTNQQLFTL